MLIHSLSGSSSHIELRHKDLYATKKAGREERREKREGRKEKGKILVSSAVLELISLCH